MRVPLSTLRAAYTEALETRETWLRARAMEAVAREALSVLDRIAERAQEARRD